MSRQCACGGLIRTHELTDGRTAWTCKDCGRYEAMTPRATVADAELAQLIDKRREQAAKLAGVDLEVCMAVGDRDGARRHLDEMKAQTLARHAAKFAGWEASH